MNAPGSLDRPSPYGTAEQHALIAQLLPRSFEHRSPSTGLSTNRNRQMQLMPESLSRTRMQDSLRQAESERTGHRLLTAQRMQRKAERASLRALRALAMAVMQ
ncbi:hypothetical protein JGS22_017020 [Streptomyces sp. P38-E01]|uniref:Uncharacterized protein n=1 Tax=Streptomyces tardus TaxID=2780544 RepID=A0A949N5S5_9ACTN|nr:hypothetical protein [Streptomyces tardus]MBU7599269.1 hypothetical protein [Streptomyces tardus]